MDLARILCTGRKKEHLRASLARSKTQLAPTCQAREDNGVCNEMRVRPLAREDV